MAAVAKPKQGQLMLFDVFQYITQINLAPPQREKVGRFLHFGGGVQSSTIAEMIVEGELPRVDFAIFADTGCEPPWVYEQVWYMAGRLASVGIPLIIVQQTPAGLMLDAMAEGGRFVTMPLYTIDEKGKIGQLKRQCTSEYKITPSSDYVKSWLINHGYGKVSVDKNGVSRRNISRKIYVEDVYGISLDEWSRAGRRGAKWQHATYPLIEKRMTREDCVIWLKSRGLRVPLKSSCIVCPYHSNAYWQLLAEMYPVIFEAACVFDDFIRTLDARKKKLRKLKQEVYLHPSCKPLRKVNFKTNVTLPPELCGDQCHT